MIKVLVLLRDAAARDAWMDRVARFKDVMILDRNSYRYILEKYEYICRIYTDTVLNGRHPDLILYDSALSNHTVDFFMCSKLPPQEITI